MSEEIANFEITGPVKKINLPIISDFEEEEEEGEEEEVDDEIITKMKLKPIKIVQRKVEF